MLFLFKNKTGKVMSNKLLLILSITLFNSSPFKVSAATMPEVQAFFLPQDQSVVKATLDLLLDEAHWQVLMAMYWLTDDEIRDKLITLKRRGIDVQVILNEYSFEHSTSKSLMENLLENNIIPLILASRYPRSGTGLSPTEGTGLMHNKFFVVDNRIVWTGSANFTKRALGPYTDSFNNENIVIIYNEDLAEKFGKAFFDIEKEISDAYIKIIENNPSDQIPSWLKILSRALYKHNPRFKELVNIHPKKDALRKFLKERAKVGQRLALKRLGYSDIVIEYISEEDARKIIIEAEMQRATFPH
jgi:phosphatidylserine/phosphatidylglycerophosphate/cardiolipin synthase-like enzyme